MIVRKFRSLTRSVRARHVLLMVSAAVLLATSIFWAILSVKLQNYNADQLIDSYLFESGKVFSQATFPSAHTFLLKWPLFALAAAFSNSTLAVTVLSVLCALAPVAALAWLLSTIERRPAVLSLWFLALSSVLLMIPAQAAPGVFLPVNFAMFTTRNVEYALFLVVITLLVRSRHWRDRSAWAAGILAAVLMASDGLFMPLLVGSLWLMLLLRRGRSRRILGWLLIAVLGYLGGVVLIIALQQAHVTQFSDGSSVTPYGVGGGLKHYAEGAVYAVLAVLTQFGANPVYAHMTLSGLPGAVVSALRSVYGLGYVINFVLVMGMLLLTGQFVWRRTRKSHKSTRSASIAEILLGAAVVATIIYILTEHYYPVDSRYLTIWLFAIFAAGAVSLRQRKVSQQRVTVVGLVLLVLLPLSILGSHHQYRLGRAGLEQTAQFQKSVAQQVSKHHIGVLIGDYWDVTPIRQQSSNRPTIIPLSTCTTAQVALASSAWQQVSSSTSIGYLVNDQPLPTGFKRCDVAAVKRIFGEPTEQIAVTTPGHPNATLYVYSSGLRDLPRASPVAAPVVVKAPQPKPDCTEGKILNIVAHEDDDLLFMNPDLQHSIMAKQCIMSVFLTSGDAGSGTGYSVSRQTGSQTAYARMYGIPPVWNGGVARYQGKRIIQATLQGAPHLTLLYLNLPDGNLHGEGFTTHNGDSLAKLRTATIPSITSIDGTTAYTDAELTAVLKDIMGKFHPTEVRTQNYSNNILDGDHSDHHATGHYATVAFNSYAGEAVLKSYIGYPGRGLSVNVLGADLANKQAAFFAYGGFDGAACSSVVSCSGPVVYGTYLGRQYSRIVRHHAIEDAASTRGYVLPEQDVIKQYDTQHSCVTGHKPEVINCLLNRR